MSDSSESAFGFLSNWKFGLAVCVPCFAVGLGVTYYYYTKSPGESGQRANAAAKDRGAKIGADGGAARKSENGAAAKDRQKVRL